VGPDKERSGPPAAAIAAGTPAPLAEERSLGVPDRAPAPGPQVAGPGPVPVAAVAGPDPAPVAAVAVPVHSNAREPQIMPVTIM
jgi:hypothetical protein